jgi:hypothetical protein
MLGVVFVFTTQFQYNILVSMGKGELIMVVSRNTSWKEFIQEAQQRNSKVVAKVAENTVIMFVCDNYYEVNMVNHTFGRLVVVGMMSYQRGALVPKERLDFMKNMHGDLKVTEVTSSRCKVFCFKRVGMFYA